MFVSTNSFELWDINLFMLGELKYKKVFMNSMKGKHSKHFANKGSKFAIAEGILMAKHLCVSESVSESVSQSVSQPAGWLAGWLPS